MKCSSLRTLKLSIKIITYHRIMVAKNKVIRRTMSFINCTIKKIQKMQLDNDEMYQEVCEAIKEVNQRDS